MDYEDTDIVVDEQFSQFADIYRPFIREVEPFKDSIKLLQPEESVPINDNQIINQGSLIKFVSLHLDSNNVDDIAWQPRVWTWVDV